MTNLDFKIKDIVFVAIEKKMHILPAQVVGKITREGIEGTKLEMTIQFPDCSTKTVSSSRNIFKSIEEAREKLLGRVTKSIDNMCSIALKSSQEHFGGADSTEDVVQSIKPDPAVDDENVFLVEMPDGTTARVRDNTNTAQL